MNALKKITIAVGTVAITGFSVGALAQPHGVILPAFKEGQYVHKAPTVDDINADKSLHPELRKVILKGRDMFMDTQKYRGKYVFNDMSCKSCHMGEGRMAWSGPVWPAATTLPDFRGKNGHVNSLEERIVGCFSFSMNGIPPAYGSDDMLAITSYHQYMAKGAKVYDSNIAGRGFNSLGNQMPKDISYEKGQQVYTENCQVCHGADGAGKKVDGKVVFPALWGDNSYNWGAGMIRVFTAASFIKNNMPLGQPGRLSDKEAWDVALYINSQERPQDPRYTGNAKETREKFLNFHKFSMYGTERNGKILGQHDNTGSKPILKPELLRPRSFE
ncbi:c-type cytochrome [Venatoribacter cucullus]|uniref:C-type cytochrome n=1 Tax=Venatoribacter cucullus TaxID=2661630 RepID=A0A9X7UVA0_9GAMM|nr:c-type cytochrome [Venatoribacter cucullus]QQD23525.1 c-type cytochrome [Venatoribacter cucullus]